MLNEINFFYKILVNKKVTKMYLSPKYNIK